MDLEAELEGLRAEPAAKAIVAACADLARRAVAVDDLATAISAKQCETETSRHLGLHQHTVVCCAEVLELWAQVKARELDLPKGARRHLVWALKHGAGSAMDLPEIPLATVRELIAATHEVLAHFDAKPFAAWELEARLAYLEGDRATVEDRVAWLAPAISVRSHLWHHADCPGCALMQFVTYLGLDAPIEEVEAALAPLHDPAPFALDREIVHIVSRIYGDDKMCENAEKWFPARMARAYVRAGQLAQAQVLATKALAVTAQAGAERRARAQVAALEVALAADRLAEAAGHYEQLVATLAEQIEDPYELLDAHGVAYRAARALARVDAADHHRAVALALARRVDARLTTPRHERETLAALAAW